MVSLASSFSSLELMPHTAARGWTHLEVLDCPSFLLEINKNVESLKGVLGYGSPGARGHTSRDEGSGLGSCVLKVDGLWVGS